MSKVKKILHYSDSREFGGAEIYLADLFLEFDKSKYKSVFVYIKNTNSNRFKARLGCMKSYELKFPYSWMMLGEIIKNEDPDIIHLNMNVPFSCFFILFLLKFSRNRKVIATVHSAVSPKSKYLFGKTLKAILCKILFPVVDRFVCVSNNSKSEFCENYGVSKEKVSVVYNGIRPFTNRIFRRSDREAAKKFFNILPDQKVVGCVARLDRDKGVEYLLRAFLEVVKNRKDSVCLIVGDGNDKRRLMSIVRSLDIERYVLFVGYVDNAEKIYAAMDIFVLPSTHESFPLTILEAMHAGDAVVATDVGGIPEVIHDGVNGFLVKPKDPVALRESIAFLLSYEEKMSGMGLSAKEDVDNNFSFKKMLTNTEHEFSLLMM